MPDKYTVNKMFSPGIELGTFCVLDRCDNRYTTKTDWPEVERRGYMSEQGYWVGSV